MVAPWITVDDLEDPTSPFADEAVASASWLLWMLSARKYGGVRTTTEVYCQMGLDEIGMQYPVSTGSGWQIYPYLREGVITNMIGGCCSTCGCPHLIRLRGAPILSVASMFIGGRELAAEEIAIYDYSYISAGSDRCWSSCDDIEVTYTYGTPPPVMGKRAAKELADQFILAATGDDACSLPARVTQVSRQGMSWTLLDPQDFLDKGLTGVYGVDLFLRAVNPYRALLRARVFSPDTLRGKTRRIQQPTVMMAPALMSAMTAGPAATMMVSTPMMPRAESRPVATATAAFTSAPVAVSPVIAYENRPLRWVVPGSYDVDNPPVVTVRPSGEEVPPDAVMWRTGNYTVDLTAEQVEKMLPSGSGLEVSSQGDDGSTTGQATYPVERRTL